MLKGAVKSRENRTAAVAQAQPQPCAIEQREPDSFRGASRCGHAAAGLAPQPPVRSFTRSGSLQIAALPNDQVFSYKKLSASPKRTTDAYTPDNAIILPVAGCHL